MPQWLVGCVSWFCQLSALSEVERRIKPKSISQESLRRKKKGISLGEMQAKLLAKIEELTLHVIAQDKRAMLREERITHLEAENQQLRIAGR